MLAAFHTRIKARALAGVDFGPAEAACPHGFAPKAHLERAAKVLG